MIILKKPYIRSFDLVCASCGKKANIDSFCYDCWLKDKSLFQVEDFEIKFCRKCYKILDRSNVGSYSMDEESIKRFAIGRIITKNKITEKEAFVRKIGNRYYVTINCKGFIYPCDKQKEESKNIFIKMKETLCERCRKMSGEQYDAIIQIRTNKYLPIRNMKADKIERVKEGINLYFLYKSDAEKALKLLKGFKIKRSFKIVGEKDTKRIYREYYSVKEYDERKSRNSRRESKTSERRRSNWNR